MGRAAFRRRGKSTLKELQGTSKRFWICDKCLTRLSSKPSSRDRQCLVCGGDLIYFPSERQADRFSKLKQMEHYRLIRGLECEPPFPIEINGKLVFTYRADFLYFNDSGMIVEDVKATKNPKGHDPVFKLKKKTVEAYYGITIEIVT